MFSFYIKKFYTRSMLGCLTGALVFLLLMQVDVGRAFGQIYIDIDAPAARKFTIAAPDFLNLEAEPGNRELERDLPAALMNALDLSGFFQPLDREAYLQDRPVSLSRKDLRLKDWSVIGAELLVLGAYSCVGDNIEVEVKVYDVFWGREILGKRLLGDRHRYRRTMHRIGNDLIKLLTGAEGMFLTKIAFVGDATGKKEIYTCSFDGKDVEQITFDGEMALFPNFSRDGSKLFYNSYKEQEGILVMRDMKSGRVSVVSSRRGLNLGGAWSPDGRRIALTYSDEGEQALYTIDPRGSNPRRLTEHYGINVSPTFSPEGDRLAYVSNRSGSPQIYIMDMADGTEERITYEGNYNTSPDWSSTGKIAFVSMSDGVFHIYTINPDGSGATRLTRGRSDNEDPSWSPDGRYIVFSSNRAGSHHLYLMDAWGENQRRITLMDGEQITPCWGP
jgi:TolB protein